MAATVLATAKLTSFSYNLRLRFRFYASSFLKICVFVLENMRFRFFLRFYASSFFFAFAFFLRLRFLRFRFFASSFSEICVFVLWNMRFRSLKYASSFFSKNENDVNLAVASTVDITVADVLRFYVILMLLKH